MKNDKDCSLPGFPPFQRKIVGSTKQNYRFFSLPVIVLLEIFPLFGEYLAKDGKIHVYTIMNSNSRYTGHKSSYSTKHRLIQKYYVNAFNFNNKSQQDF